MTMANSLVVLKNSKSKQPISTVNMAIRLQYLWFCVGRNMIGIEPTSFFDVQTTQFFMDLGVRFLRHPVTRATRESYSETRDSFTGFFFDGFDSFSMTVLDSVRGLILAMNTDTSLNS